MTDTRVEYLAYLGSDRWALIRLGALHRAGYRCQTCGGRNRLQVHHLTYARLGDERPEDLRVLCDGCHAAAHRRSR